MPPADLVTPQINLKLIQTFLTVAEMRSFRRAADQVKRSQSAVSMQIRQLEEQLGVALFHRTTRSVKLTSEGEKLVGSAKKAIGEMENGIRDLLEAADSRRDHVTIACSPTIAPRQLPPILMRFVADYPRINIILKELKSQDLFESIRRGEADFGIGPAITDGDFEFSTVVSDRVCALMSNDYLPGRKDSVRCRQSSTMCRRCWAASLTRRRELMEWNSMSATGASRPRRSWPWPRLVSAPRSSSVRSPDPCDLLNYADY
jgi:DNA-binding transcriptional LysR family regulator